MKKIIAILLLSVIITVGAAACGGSEITLEETGAGMAAEAVTASAAAAGEVSAEVAGVSSDASADTMGEGETIAAPAQEETPICVYVCGAVVSPGVYALPEGSRIYEALELAGGVTAEADIGVVNQAQVLSDGLMIRIPAMGESAAQDTVRTADAATTGTSGTSGLVNINTADAAQLMTLPGIGESKAAAILQYRNQHGSFADKEDLLNVPGIGSATYSNLESQIAVQ